tara:strand:- start:331 stop:768 length:438 start_codon:yes stop_codon:yes gene_type:complete
MTKKLGTKLSLFSIVSGYFLLGVLFRVFILFHQPTPTILNEAPQVTYDAQAYDAPVGVPSEADPHVKDPDLIFDYEEPAEHRVARRKLFATGSIFSYVAHWLPPDSSSGNGMGLTADSELLMNRDELDAWILESTDRSSVSRNLY